MVEKVPEPPDGTREDAPGLHAAVLAELTVRLAERSSRLVVAGQLDPEFRRNVAGILDETVQLLYHAGQGRIPAVAIDYLASPGLRATGRLRAQQNMHPAESLMAAEVLFDMALPVLAGDRVLTPDTRDGAVVAAQALHHAIWRRFPPGAIAYAEALRQQLSSAHRESRQRLSRDLHDRIAHNIASGIQRVELATLSGEVLPDSVTESLGNATTILREALEEVRDLALELRAHVGDLFIDEALRQYAENMTAEQPVVEVTSVGPPRPIREWIGEELFIIVVEAIRNAKEHAPQAKRVLVSFAWDHHQVAVQVSDDGPGFRSEDIRPGAIGLAAMAERAEIIGAELSVTSAAGQGTRVRIVLPSGAPSPAPTARRPSGGSQ